MELLSSRAPPPRRERMEVGSSNPFECSASPKYICASTTIYTDYVWPTEQINRARKLVRRSKWKGGNGRRGKVESRRRRNDVGKHTVSISISTSPRLQFRQMERELCDQNIIVLS